MMAILASQRPSETERKQEVFAILKAPVAGNREANFHSQCPWASTPSSQDKTNRFRLYSVPATDKTGLLSASACLSIEQDRSPIFSQRKCNRPSAQRYRLCSS